jgi:hypothetical protein
MKRFLATLLILTSSVAFAQHRNPYGYATGSPQHHHHHRHGGDLRWIAPAIITGAVVYAITRPPVVVQQPPVVIQQPPVVAAPSNDIVYIDGVPYRKQWILVNGAYQEVLVRI